MNTVLRNTRSISTLSLLILLLASGIVGAVLSYLWTEGYYASIRHRIPEGITTITITNVTFPLEDSTYFDVAVLNPSYSKADANITSIAIIATTDYVETIYAIPASSIEPSIPHPLTKGDAITFKCNRNWGAFAGQTIRVAVFLEDDSGATFSYKTSKVELEIIDVELDTAVTVERFNVTIKNSAESLIQLNVTEIMFDSTSIPSQNITLKNGDATLPQQFQQGQSMTFVCNWNLWRIGALDGSSHTITAKTLQGYSAIKTESLPSQMMLNITDIAFNVSDTSRFNVTIHSFPSSPHFVNISKVTITNGSQILEDVKGVTPFGLLPGENVTIQCLWDWGEFRAQEVKITVYTTQGFYTYEYTIFPDEE